MGSNVSSVKLSANDHLPAEDDKSTNLKVEQQHMPTSRRKTITTFDNQMSRVSIVSIRYDSPINVGGEDTSDITFEIFDLAMARVFTFLDITSLLMCSSACKRFRELENKYQDVIWQNLYKFHKTNMMYICTNPSQALQMMEETKKKHQASDSGGSSNRKGTERNELGLLVNDPILLELKKDVKNWKEECLNYYFVKRKFISSQQEYLLLSKLRELQSSLHPSSSQPENPTRRKSIMGQLQQPNIYDNNNVENELKLGISRHSESSDSSGGGGSSSDDDFKFDVDDDFLKKKSMEFMMYNNVKSSMIDNDNPFAAGSDDEDSNEPNNNNIIAQKHNNNEEALNPNLNRWKEAESDSDDDNWLEDQEKEDEEREQLDLKSPNQILQEKIGMSNLESESDENSFAINTPLALLRAGGAGGDLPIINNSNIKHFEESSDEEEDWFNDDDEKSKDTSIIEPIVKKGERASEIESQTKLHVKNDFTSLDMSSSASEIKIEISSENDNNKHLKRSSTNSLITLRLPSIDDSDNDDENLLLGRGASASDIKLVFPPDDSESSSSNDNKKKVSSTPKIKDESERSARSSFEEDIDDSRGSHKKSSFLISKSSNNDDDSDPWYSDEESTKKTVLLVESEHLNINKNNKEETDSDTDDWYSESEDDKKSNSHFGLTLKDNEESHRDSSSCYSVSKLGFGSNIPSFLGSQSDTARRIKEAENLTLDELITDLTDVTKLKETYLNRSNAETQQFYSKLLSFHQRTQVLCGDGSFEDTMPDAVMAPNDWPTTLSFFQQKKGQGIVIKLIYIEETQTPYPAKLCNPVLKFFGSKSKEMKSVCSGLIIGPFLLQWNKTHSLIVPRKLVSDSYLYQTRTHRIAELFNVTLDSIIDTIAKIIVEWNLTKLYHDQLQNCQHFVEKIIDSLGIKKVLETERIGKTIFNYNTILNREGKGSIELNFSDQAKHDKLYACLEKKYGSGKVTFENHKQLDEFMRLVISEDPNFTITHHQDYSLLVFFDQLFWAKHSLLPNEDQYKPLHDEKSSSTLCPFGSLAFGTATK